MTFQIISSTRFFFFFRNVVTVLLSKKKKCKNGFKLSTVKQPTQARKRKENDNRKIMCYNDRKGIIETSFMVEDLPPTARLSLTC